MVKSANRCSQTQMYNVCANGGKTGGGTGHFGWGEKKCQEWNTIGLPGEDKD